MKAKLRNAYQAMFDKIRKYFKDVFIVVLGVSLSFLLNEWRLGVSAHDDEKEILLQVVEDLKADTAKLKANRKELVEITKSSIKLVEMTRDSVLANAMEAYIATKKLITYVPFEASKVGYFELSAQGKSGKIKDKKLLMRIMELHENGYRRIDELTNTHRDYLVKTIYEYNTRKMPFLMMNESELSVATQEAIANGIVADEFKHMLFFEIVLKQNIIEAYDTVLEEQEKMIVQINEKLAKN